MRSGSGYIFREELTGSAEGLDRKHERKREVKNDVRVCLGGRDGKGSERSRELYLEHVEMLMRHPSGAWT